MKLVAPFFIFFMTFACMDISGQTVRVTVNGNWTLNVPLADLTEAGMDYAGNYQSSPNQVQISHNVTPPGQWRNHTWELKVHMETIVWDNHMQLWIRRTGNGSGSSQQCTPLIMGGLDYQQVTVTSTEFYSGACAYSDVPLQFELRNVSVLIPANNYSADIVYTITANR